jgi:3,4-dihydroxy 2-butanone 4-phosphate synthase/GTP cyclohydrolase II
MPDFDPIEDVIRAVGEGEIVIVIDDAERENEGDLIMAAEHITPGAVNFMVTHARGILCLAAPPERLRQLDLDEIVPENTALMGTPFTVPIDVREGTTTGSSAFDRAATIQRFMDPDARPTDFARPGHVFPLKAAQRGVLQRPGHTEASVDLARLAGAGTAGVLCEILGEDGHMARAPDFAALAERFQLKVTSIRDIIAYRRQREGVARCTANTHLPTPHGEFELRLYETADEKAHVALLSGQVNGDEPVLVRVHDECLTGDVFMSRRCDCGEQLDRAMQMVQESGRGVVIYLRQEGRGIGLANKIRAYGLQDAGMDTVEANRALGFSPDGRDYTVAAEILRDLGVRHIRLLTNNPNKRQSLESQGFEIIEILPLLVTATEENARYLETKRSKLGHTI